MGLFDFFGEVGQAVTEAFTPPPPPIRVTVNDTVSEAIVNSIVRTGNKSQSSVSQTNTITLSGKITGGDGIVQSNIANINLSSVVNAAQMGTLQSDIVNDVMTNLKTDKKTLFGGGSSDETRITNIVRNVVNSNITAENMSELQSKVKQGNIIQSTQDFEGKDMGKIEQYNVADLIVKMANNTSQEIANALNTSFTSKYSSEDKSKDLLNNATDNIGELGKSVLDLFGNPMFIIGIIIVIALGAFIYLKYVAKMISGGTSHPSTLSPYSPSLYRS